MGYHQIELETGEGPKIAFSTKQGHWEYRIKDGPGHFTKNDELCVNPYPTAFPYGNGMVLHFYQQQEGSTTKTVHKVINKGLKAYV